jgi:hypothetical protein
MNYDNINNKLEANASTFKSLLENISGEQVQWKHSADKLSLLEIVNHLYDEKRGDFRQRIKNIFKDLKKEWAPMVRAEWVTERDYAIRDIKKSLNNFPDERKNLLNG